MSAQQPLTQTTAQQDLLREAQRITAERVNDTMDLDEKTTMLELVMMELLEIKCMTPPVGRPATLANGGIPGARGRWLMHEEPRLPKMPAAPTLKDFFNYRILLDKRGGNHLLQSAQLARENGLSDKMVLGCLLHDISVIALIRSDHGHWGAQLVEPYVDEEVSWAIRHHQALKFRPDPALGYEYPKNYLEAFGEDYDPPAHVKLEWDYCSKHRWYESAMQICMNDLYAFDPEKMIDIDTFDDIISENFRQPEQGLGFDGSPSAHMWRTLIWPNNFL